MLSRWQSTIVDAQGNVQPLANLTVRNEADQSLAKMWASPGATQPLPDGMVQADGNGYAFFYARGGLYRITSVALGIDWRGVQIGAAFVSIGDYAAGLEITARNQIFWRWWSIRLKALATLLITVAQAIIYLPEMRTAVYHEYV